MMKVGIIDCRASNLASVINAFDCLGFPTGVVRNPDDMDDYSHLVLPGVGSFGQGMAHLSATGLDEAIRRQVGRGKPLLGICLGMQLLGLSGEESGFQAGIGLIPGAVRRIPLPPDSPLRLPHIGWNLVSPSRDCRLFAGIPPDPAFYFVHSYAYDNPSAEYVVGQSEYAGPLVAVIERDSVFGVQFHPEKSQKAGLRLLKNFVEKC